LRSFGLRVCPDKLGFLEIGDKRLHFLDCGKLNFARAKSLIYSVLQGKPKYGKHYARQQSLKNIQDPRQRTLAASLRKLLLDFVKPRFDRRRLDLQRAVNFKGARGKGYIVGHKRPLSS
jgi:hypothetical protein